MKDPSIDLPPALFVWPGGARQEALRSSLRLRGLQLLEPVDDAEARTVLPELHADLYLVECAEVGKALERLAALAEDRVARETPAVVVTGGPLAVSEVHALYDAGAVDVLAAPLDLPVVLARIGALLRLQRRLREARELSMRDALTGLYNRRFFYERLEQEVSRAMRLGQGLALVLFDVDWFKKVNDTFGHPAGDAVLQTLADLASRHTRRSDVVARVGGDEFALLLSSNGGEGARVCAEGLRKRLADTRFEPSAELKVTLSIGVAAWPSREVARPLEDLVRVADAALLRAKALGRDRVVVAGDPAVAERGRGVA